MEAQLTRLTHKIAIQLRLVAESCTICTSRSRRPVRKLLDTLSYIICLQMEALGSSEMSEAASEYLTALPHKRQSIERSPVSP
jgi:hypothetical protein